MKAKRPDDVWIVCGTRHASDYDHVRAILDRIRSLRGLPRRLFHGAGPGKPGVDTLAAHWADSQTQPPRIEVRAFPPKGPKPHAFHARNRAMAAAASMYRKPRCIALPGASIRSQGTINMVGEAARVGIPCYVFPIALSDRPPIERNEVVCECGATLEVIDSRGGCHCGHIEV